MTVTAQQCYTPYYDEVGGTNHNDTFKMPTEVGKLDEKPARGWHAVAQFASEHARVFAEDSVAAAHRHMSHKIEDRDAEIRELRAKLNKRDVDLLAANDALSRYDAVREMFRGERGPEGKQGDQGPKGDTGVQGLPGECGCR